MRRSLFVAAFAGALCMLIAGDGGAIGLGPKVKAKKLQGDLVNAMSCVRPDPAGSDPLDCDPQQALVPPSPGEASPRSTCSIKAGKFKSQVGKDLSVQIKGLSCSGALPSGLCIQVDGYSTIMDEELDKSGGSTPASCTFLGVIPLEGTSSFSQIAVGAIPCDAKGKCKGTVANVAADPCPGVDKQTEIRRVLVFDGPTDTVTEVLPGVFLGECDPNQAVLARPGTVTPGQ
ncbi:MAG: hypothetical protein ACE5FG_05930 [Myxococcota bacterium]